MTGASSIMAASTTARAISRLLTLKEGTANRCSKTYLRNNRGLVTNISFCRLRAIELHRKTPPKLHSIANRIRPDHFVCRWLGNHLIPGARGQEQCPRRRTESQDPEPLSAS